MTLRADGRHVVSVTMKPPLYRRLQEVCKALDVPVTAWCRDAIAEHLKRFEPVADGDA